MKRISLIATFTLLLGVLFLENCKKDTVDAVATSTYFFAATINDSTWVTDTTTASVTYNALTKSKVFACFGTSNHKKLNITLTKTNSTNTNGFPVGTYNVDATPNLLMTYSSLQKNSSGDLVYVPHGIVAPGSGTINISVVDSVNKVITGTFSFTTLTNNYDTNGNVISVTINTVLDGGLNKMPYTFTSN